jgi:methylglutaconyl-CoA hydratase
MSEPVSPALLARREGPVAFVTLNRPDVRNAFDDRLVADLAAWAGQTARDPGVRVAVLGGAGKVFSAGADLGWMASMVDYTREANLADAGALADMLGALNTLPQPLVGRVQGVALGGGAGLAAVCDIVVAADSAVFGFTEVKLGILPAVISPFVVAKIGVSRARELFLTGARFGAGKALELGLVHRVVSEADLDAAVDDYVRELLSSGPGAVAAAKRLIDRVAGRPASDVRDLTIRAIADQRVSAEGQEGLRAFLGRRRPSWAPPS